MQTLYELIKIDEEELIKNIVNIDLFGFKHFGKNNIVSRLATNDDSVVYKTKINNKQIKCVIKFLKFSNISMTFHFYYSMYVNEKIVIRKTKIFKQDNSFDDIVYDIFAEFDTWFDI